MSNGSIRRVVLVTGASRGLGRAIALAFGKHGDRVVVNYLKHREAADDVVLEINRSGGESCSYQADIGSSAQVDAMVADAVQRWGSVDVLINNAGITRDRLMLRMSDEDWDAVLSCNLRGPFNCIRAVSVRMADQRFGHIVNIVSISGVRGREGQSNYAASKAGLIGLTKTCSRELGAYNIKVNAVLPGYLPTDMGKTVSDLAHERIVKESVLGRTTDQTEVATFIRHLVTMNNVSGQVFNIDSRIL